MQCWTCENVGCASILPSSASPRSRSSYLSCRRCKIYAPKNLVLLLHLRFGCRVFTLRCTPCHIVNSSVSMSKWPLTKLTGIRPSLVHPAASSDRDAHNEWLRKLGARRKCCKAMPTMNSTISSLPLYICQPVSLFWLSPSVWCLDFVVLVFSAAVLRGRWSNSNSLSSHGLRLHHRYLPTTPIATCSEHHKAAPAYFEYVAIT